jgi:hypothetical protein
MNGGVELSFPPPLRFFHFSAPRMLAPHWSLAAKAHHGSQFTKCFGYEERATIQFMTSIYDLPVNWRS